jgi:hypothetical protein
VNVSSVEKATEYDSTAVPDAVGAVHEAVSSPSPPLTLSEVGSFKYGATVVVVVLDVVVVGAGAIVVDVVDVVVVVVVVEVVVVVDVVVEAATRTVVVGAIVVEVLLEVEGAVVEVNALFRGSTTADSMTTGTSAR